VSELLGEAGLDVIFGNARTHTRWQDKPVEDALLARLWSLARLGPTAANASPARIVFVKTPEAKERLRPHLSAGNVTQTMTAPVTAIVGYDLDFHEQLPKLFPHTDARAWFAGDDKIKARYETAFRNGSLQGGYLIVAARALGLDCGPMSGFERDGVDAAFFAGTSVRANFLCNLGYGDASTLRPRGPRLAFAEACEIV
jgi:3-hydroxypropanoate dehydrogenase